MSRRVSHIALVAAIAAFIGFSSVAYAQRHMEKLGRGVVAVNQGEGKVFVSWRMLGTDPDNIGFNLYRTTSDAQPTNNDAQPTKLNAEPMTKVTSYQDTGVDLAKDNAYFVRPIVDGKEGEMSKPFMNNIAANSAAKNYFSIPIKGIEGYAPNDCSVGDLDGDGEYEIIVHMTGRARDNSAGGLTDPPVFQAYKLDGTLMWTINLGKNVREGAHYTQFLVADFDGDGRAEMICKTADGTKDGTGTIVGDPNADWVGKEGIITHRDTTGSERTTGGAMKTNPDGTHDFIVLGRILTGPEYLTVFDGLTGKALATTDYIPARGDVNDYGDGYGNRSERYVAAAAYLDGKLPSAVMCRGYYGKSVLAAWNWRGGKLTHLWTFDTHDPAHPENRPFAGQGNHGCSVADVDDDGKDEIVYGSMCVDDNGKGLWTAGLGHGDALHVSDFDPARPGLEVYGIHEGGRTSGTAMLDARTGTVIWETAKADVGRGLAGDIDPAQPGAEFWGGPRGVRNVRGEQVESPAPGSANFAAWWDGDLLREILNSNKVDKPGGGNLLTAEGCTSNNGTKSTPALSGDFFGDWREEVMLRTSNNQELRIFTTAIPTEHRFPTLMHDSQYRMAIAWQNVAYNQPPWPSFFIGHDMKPAPRPNITTEPVMAAK
ncbi:MAG: rhamnogalacturonan lyase [Burkholderiales bacterium]|nr:rhamnogalacturonan lyase [Phycisphaerae bacterium]